MGKESMDRYDAAGYFKDQFALRDCEAFFRGMEKLEPLLKDMIAIARGVHPDMVDVAYFNSSFRSSDRNVRSPAAPMLHADGIWPLRPEILHHPYVRRYLNDTLSKKSHTWKMKKALVLNIWTAREDSKGLLVSPCRASEQQPNGEKLVGLSIERFEQIKVKWGINSNQIYFASDTRVVLKFQDALSAARSFVGKLGIRTTSNGCAQKDLWLALACALLPESDFEWVQIIYENIGSNKPFGPFVLVEGDDPFLRLHDLIGTPEWLSSVNANQFVSYESADFANPSARKRSFVQMWFGSELFHCSYDKRATCDIESGMKAESLEARFLIRIKDDAANPRNLNDIPDLAEVTQFSGSRLT